ncbi:MAG: hypothetical protein N3D11_13635 [Candidatus Sumerlaeia bacterium]|nr:hypothetical protein [Candidatus Sumerlaeia bacterium]
MKYRSGWMEKVVTLPRPARRALAAVGGVCVLIAAAMIYDYLSINLWLERDAGLLESYPVRLIEDQKPVAQPTRDAVAQMDRLLIEWFCREQRNVVTLSRSEFHYNLLKTRGYAKVFLETAPPEQPDRRAPLRLVCTLKRTVRGWELAGPPREKTIR